MSRIGWATSGLSPSSLLGSDDTSFAIDGFHVSSACVYVHSLQIIIRLVNGGRMSRKNLVRYGKKVMLLHVSWTWITR